jgi:hypothetical protein
VTDRFLREHVHHHQSHLSRPHVKPAAVQQAATLVDQGLPEFANFPYAILAEFVDPPYAKRVGVFRTPLLCKSASKQAAEDRAASPPSARYQRTTHDSAGVDYKAECEDLRRRLEVAGVKLEAMTEKARIAEDREQATNEMNKRTYQAFIQQALFVASSGFQFNPSPNSGPGGYYSFGGPLANAPSPNPGPGGFYSFDGPPANTPNGQATRDTAILGIALDPNLSDHQKAQAFEKALATSEAQTQAIRPEVLQAIAPLFLAGVDLMCTRFIVANEDEAAMVTAMNTKDVTITAFNTGIATGHLTALPPTMLHSLSVLRANSLRIWVRRRLVFPSQMMSSMCSIASARDYWNPCSTSLVS